MRTRNLSLFEREAGPQGAIMGKGSLTHHYFVDESGCLTLFNRKGRCIVGREGCSRFFMLGQAHLVDPEEAAKQLQSLREALLGDPYFRGVPSMRPEASKTALHFHAKDDLPEVRREVFHLLQDMDVRVRVIVRHKSELVTTARMLLEQGQRLTDSMIYDDLVKRLFRDSLHKADNNRIVFARRGKSARAEAIEDAITKAKRNFERKWSIPSKKPTSIISAFPWEQPGLQIVDYFCWALFRMLERHEERFFELLRPKYKLIIDLDDKRTRPYGEYYSERNPLTLDKIKAF